MATLRADYAATGGRPLSYSGGSSNSYSNISGATANAADRDLRAAFGGGGANRPDEPNLSQYLGEAKSAYDAAVSEVRGIANSRFTDPKFYTKGFQEAFERYESTAKEVATAEVAQARDQLAAHLKTTPDARGAVNFELARRVRSQIAAETGKAAYGVYSNFAEQVFKGVTAAADFKAKAQQTAAGAMASLAGSMASLTGSLANAQANVYSSGLDYASRIASIEADVLKARDQWQSDARRGVPEDVNAWMRTAPGRGTGLEITQTGRRAADAAVYAPGTTY